MHAPEYYHKHRCLRKGYFYFQMKEPFNHPDMYRDKFAEAVMKEVPVIGTNGASEM